MKITCNLGLLSLKSHSSQPHFQMSKKKFNMAAICYPAYAAQKVQPEK